MGGFWRGRWIALALGFALIGAILSAASPAAAYPVQAAQVGSQLVCPTGWDVLITFGPLNGYCAENSGNTATTCPVGTSLGTHDGAPVCNLVANGLPGSPAVGPRGKLSTLSLDAVALQAQVLNWVESLLGPPATDPWAEPLTNAYLHNSSGGSIGGGNGGHGANLGMYLQPSAADLSSSWVTGGVGAIRSSGLGLTDSAGLLAPGATTPTFREESGGGGIVASFDASPYLAIPGDQSLVLKASFGYTRSNATLDPVPAPALALIGSGGTLQNDTYTFDGSLMYTFDMNYVVVRGAYNFGNGNETNNLDSSTGSFHTGGYTFDLKFGHVFTLFDATGRARPALPTKAPPKPLGGYLIGLDLTGHVAYTDQWISGFTDSTGFAFGEAEGRLWGVGGRAKLFALVPGNALTLTPYAAVTVDQVVNYSTTLSIPNQAAFVGGDVVSLQMARTYWGGQVGLDAIGPTGMKVGVRDFYTASADTSIFGSSAYLKIPLDFLAAPAKQKY